MKRYMLLFLFALLSASPASSETPPGPYQPSEAQEIYSTITGQVMINKETPMLNGVALLFSATMGGAPPNPYRYWRIPDLITPMDSNGRFTIGVPDGTYYLMVAQKDPDREIGPPKEEEFIYFHGDKDGKPRPIVVRAQGKVDLGTVTADLWTPAMIMRKKGVTAVEGTVKDLDGKPVEGAVVLAYLAPEAMGRPTFVSDRSDRKGRYLLRVSDGGKYYLRVRSVIGGGVPKEGEPLNTIQGFTPVMVSLKKGQTQKGLVLKVKRFTRATGPGGDKSLGRLKPENQQKP